MGIKQSPGQYTPVSPVCLAPTTSSTRHHPPGAATLTTAPQPRTSQAPPPVGKASHVSTVGKPVPHTTSSFPDHPRECLLCPEAPGFPKVPLPSLEALRRSQ